MVDKLERLFVYGTLAPGEKNHHLLGGISGTWESGSCNGRIFTQTRGVHIGLPCFESTVDGEAFIGKIFSSTELNTRWKILDEFEGELYDRRLVSAKTEQGLDVEVYIYADNSK